MPLIFFHEKWNFTRLKVFGLPNHFSRASMFSNQIAEFLSTFEDTFDHASCSLETLPENNVHKRCILLPALILPYFPESTLGSILI